MRQPYNISRPPELVEIAGVPGLIQQYMMDFVDNQNEQPQIVIGEPLDGLRLLATGGSECR